MDEKDLKEVLEKIAAEIESIKKLCEEPGIKNKTAQHSSTQPLYVDSNGKVFSAASIVSGYRPSKKYKGYSMSKIVTSPGYGKVKRTGKKKRAKK